VSQALVNMLCERRQAFLKGDSGLERLITVSLATS
jgi:hypothetical protein